MHATGCTDLESTTVNPIPEFQFRVLNENVVNCQYAGFQHAIKKVGPASRSTIELVLRNLCPDLDERADAVWPRLACLRACETI